MNRIVSTYSFLFCAFFILAFVFSNSYSQQVQNQPGSSKRDTSKVPSLEKRYRYTDDRLPYSMPGNEPLLFLKTPSNIKSSVDYDPKTNSYNFSEKAGSLDYKPPFSMGMDEYKSYVFKDDKNSYFNQRRKSESASTRTPLGKSINIGSEAFDKIFGTNTINIVPQGSAELIFGISTSKLNNPSLPERIRKTTTFDFQQKIQMNVTGSIGDKMKLGVNYNTEASFDFENKTKLEYTGKEDEIIKKIEAGNVSLPLTGSLITGSQSLFGLKTEMQFGKLYMTTVLSQQKGESSVIEVKGGAQLDEFDVPIDQYDANKHFFLAQYFRDNYESALKTLPVINSPIVITRIEVYVTNKSGSYENNRNIVAFLDLAENHPFSLEIGVNSFSNKIPYNEINKLYDQRNNIREISQIGVKLAGFNDIVVNRDFEKVENARKLTEREYTLNPKLGYISLNTALNADEVLAVAYEYTYNGKTYRVGELSTSGVQGKQALMLKLIKGTNLTPRLPNWKLMMKNVYAIGAYQVNREDFQLNVLYQDDKTGNAINYVPETAVNKKLLLRAMQLDNLDTKLDATTEGDGVFDFIEGVTIVPSNGRIIFPVLEPFGRTLNQFLKDNQVDTATRRKYVFSELYDSTQTKARLVSEKNKFKLKGTYQSSSSSEIALNAANVPQGSVVVTAGGMKLTENVDYTVDYMSGRVKILNQGLLESGTPIRVSLESNSLFNLQTKTLVGTHLDYKFNDNFVLGGTILHLSERPLTQKVNIGDEPISNTIWGLNGTYTKKSQFLTSLVDKIPLIQTKEPSSFTFEGEFAQLLPGHSKAIKKSGTAYIDDFEGSETTIDMKSFISWSLASTPQDPKMFPEAGRTNDLSYGFNRAKLSWYVIDNLFQRNNSATPAHIRNDDNARSSSFVREVQETDIFTNVDNPSGLPSNLNILNVAFYPRERGPYNYDTNVDQYGKLLNPKSRWGGITREIQNSDFEASNVEYIEFWMLDPFVEDATNSLKGGKLYFNLGNISEDVLKDSRKSFEHGLPRTAVPTDVDTTAWGRVPTISQPTSDAFDLNESARKYQDVGLDGLDDADEQTFFSDYLNKVLAKVTDPAAAEQIKNDPSSDDFHYYRGADYDQEKLGILERYKKYNGYEGNSPVQTNADFSASSTTLPNSEDINNDNTLSEGESYYQYSVDLTREGLAQVGKNYITDVVTATNNLKKPAQLEKWYQFRIPINNPDKVIGSIQDFKSIRFIRMFLTGYEDSVILRFAKLQLVRGEWRKYDLSLRQGAEGSSIPEVDDGKFEISAVNIERNGKRIPVNYVLPPGIDRVIDPTNPQLKQLNEQSMVLKVNDLANGDARAAYKTLNLDIRQYKRLEMEVHAERLQGTFLNNDELSLFIRLGSDNKNNYYECELPLKLTDYPIGDVGKDISESDYRERVWPEDNRINIALDDLMRAKQARNDEMRKAGSLVSYTTIFPYVIDGQKYTYYVVGNPNLSNVKTMMIGVRYRHNASSQGDTRSAEIWVNELRLTNFNEKGGWAANGRLTTKLADLGTVNIAGSTLKPGFGSIEKKVNERSKEEINTYDVSSNLELGKFFPQKSGVQIPMYVSYSESFTNPEYNPLDPDIPFKAALDNAGSDSARRAIKLRAQDYVQRKSLNFTNVKINKQEGKPHFYDLSNWTLNYAFNETYSHNIRVERNIEKNYHGGIMYSFMNRPKTIQPFQKVRLFNAKIFRLIKDFNFNLGPSSMAFRTDMSRNYMENQLRNLNNYGIPNPATVSKDWLWNRNYELSYDLTRSIKFDFTASNVARIDEPEGRVYKRERDRYEMWKDSVWRNIRNFGRPTQYYHELNLTYNLPINKLPLLDWTSSSLSYNATYGWDAAPLNQYDIGNTIKNSNRFQLAGNFTLTTLYNKVPYFKRILQPPVNKTNAPKKTKKVNYERDGVNLKTSEPRIILHNLSTPDVVVKVVDANNKQVKGKTQIVNDNKITFTPDTSVSNAKIMVEGTVEVKPNPFILIFENITKVALGVKNVSFSYSLTQGSLLPGFRPSAQILGMGKSDGMYAPGLKYILGFQDKNFPLTAIRNGWLSNSPYINSPYLMTNNESFQIRSTVEPVKGLKIELNANRTYNRNESSYWNADSLGHFPDRAQGYIENGNFSMSVISIKSAFERLTSTNYEHSKTFDKFLANRYIIIDRLALQQQNRFPAYYNPDSIASPDQIKDGTKNGFGLYSQQALIPAFLSAYGGYNPNKVTLKDIPNYFSMLPNWKITFEGLSRLALVKKFAKSINLMHAYKSSYNIGGYQTVSNAFADEYEGDISRYLNEARDMLYNFLPQKEMSSVSIKEDFSPLINLDITWKNSLSTRFEIRKSRNVVLSVSSYQITESLNNDLVVGAGYKFKDFQIIINDQKKFKSDLNLSADLSIRDNKVIIRKFTEKAQGGQGQRVFTLKLAADYNLSESFNLRLFYDRIMNTPFISTSFPTANTNFGFSLRFTLIQ